MDDRVTAFFISITAGTASYFICKWLDGNDTQHQPQGLSHPKRNRKPEE